MYTDKIVGEVAGYPASEMGLVGNAAPGPVMRGVRWWC